MTITAHDVLGNRQSLDGGAMFGNAPRALWSRWLAPDPENRVPLVTRALLLKTARGNVLLETGIGSFFDPKLKERFGVIEDEHVLLESLNAVSVPHSDVDVVILSHLHFDHAGGLLAPYEEGHAPALLFPKAQFVVGQTAFARAKAPHQRDRASFVPELPELLEKSGRLHLVDDTLSVPSFLGPEFSFELSHGHTPGMLHTLVQGREHGLFFCADLVPGRPWLHLPITMGYDRYPESLIDEKARILPKLERENTWAFFTHDPTIAAARVSRDERGRFVATEPRESFGKGFALDES